MLLVYIGWVNGLQVFPPLCEPVTWTIKMIQSLGRRFMCLVRLVSKYRGTKLDIKAPYNSKSEPRDGKTCWEGKEIGNGSRNKLMTCSKRANTLQWSGKDDAKTSDSFESLNKYQTYSSPSKEKDDPGLGYSLKAGLVYSVHFVSGYMWINGIAYRLKKLRMFLCHWMRFCMILSEKIIQNVLKHKKTCSNYPILANPFSRKSFHKFINEWYSFNVNG